MADQSASLRSLSLMQDHDPLESVGELISQMVGTCGGLLEPSTMYFGSC